MALDEKQKSDMIRALISLSVCNLVRLDLI